jgi:hypothetical protein
MHSGVYYVKKKMNNTSIFLNFYLNLERPWRVYAMNHWNCLDLLMKSLGMAVIP